jgi:hypothetical protein
MSGTFSPWALAQRLRQDAEATLLPEFARSMLRAAEELEESARSQAATTDSRPLQSQSG